MSLEKPERGLCGVGHRGDSGVRRGRSSGAFEAGQKQNTNDGAFDATFDSPFYACRPTSTSSSASSISLS